MRCYFCLVIPFVLCLSQVVAEEGARLEIAGSDVVDFGRYKAREIRSAGFSMRNSGSDAVKILKIHITCGCASAACDKSEIKPGETAGIRICTLPNSISGAYDKQVYVEYSGGSNRFIGLTIKGTAVPIVEIRPQAYVYAGRIDTNSQWEQSFEIMPTEPGVRLGQPEAKTNYPMEVRMVSMGSGANSSYRLDVRLLPSATPGDLNCAIKVPVMSPSNHPPLAIGISGKIGTELIAIPGTFRMPASGRDIVRIFHLKLLGGVQSKIDPGKILLPEERGFKCKLVQSDDGRNIVVTATFSPQFTSRLQADGKSELRFSLPGILPARVICLRE